MRLHVRIIIGVLKSCLVFGIVALLGFITSTLAQTTTETMTASPVGSELTAQDLEPFLDGVMNVVMSAHHVPGAVVAIVKDGEILFSKGYGYTDLELKRAVDPETTLFRIGSTTKPFIWTAVMQLVEQGKLDLNTDIHAYLDFRIQTSYPEPVTLAHLMAHTAGFEDKFVGLFARNPDKMRPLREVLTSDPPVQVRPPGELSAYFNYGVALAGYIVEQVSGLVIEDYLEQHIFRPLGMSHTTLRQPVPAELAPYLAHGYRFEAGQYIKNPFTYIPLYPAGSMSASATDMAHFMIAHLQQGVYGDERILQASTAELMHRSHFRHDARVAGWAHGFAEGFRGNLRTIGHGGGTNDFFTEFTLLPEHQLGLFASFNGANGFMAQRQLVEAFWDRYFPTPTLEVMPIATSQERAAQVTGYYGSTRACFTTFCKLAGIFPAMTVQSGDDQYLTVQSPFFGVRRYAEVEPWVFQQTDGDDVLVFQHGDSGARTKLFAKNTLDRAFIRQPWYEAIPFTISINIVTLLIFLSALLGWPLLRVLGRGSQSWGAAWLRGFAALTALAFVTHLVMTALALSNANEVVFGIPPLLQTALTLARVTALMALILIPLTVLVWRRGYWRIWGRLHYSLVTVAALAMTWWLWYWKVLGI